MDWGLVGSPVASRSDDRRLNMGIKLYIAAIAAMAVTLLFGGCSRSEPESGFGPIQVKKAGAPSSDSPANPSPAVTIELLRPNGTATLKPGENFECVAVVTVPEGTAIPTFVIAEFRVKTGTGTGGALAGNAKLKPAEGSDKRLGSPGKIRYKVEAEAPAEPGRYIFYVEAITVNYIVDDTGSDSKDQSSRIRSEEIRIRSEEIQVEIKNEN